MKNYIIISIRYNLSTPGNCGFEECHHYIVHIVNKSNLKDTTPGINYIKLYLL